MQASGIFLLQWQSAADHAPHHTPWLRISFLRNRYTKCMLPSSAMSTTGWSAGGWYDISLWVFVFFIGSEHTECRVSFAFIREWHARGFHVTEVSSCLQKSALITVLPQSRGHRSKQRCLSISPPGNATSHSPSPCQIDWTSFQWNSSAYSRFWYFNIQNKHKRHLKSDRQWTFKIRSLSFFVFTNDLLEPWCLTTTTSSIISAANEMLNQWLLI